MAFVHEKDRITVFFVPLFLAGHMIPMVDIARLIATHSGADVTIVTTAANAAIFQSSIDRDTKAGHRIRTHLLPFPSSQLGLPDGVENLNAAVSAHMSSQIFKGIALLKEPIELLLRQALPDCIVSDMFYTWTAGVAVELGIRRLVFHGSSYFQSCAASAATVNGENDVVSLQGLPHKVEFLKSQLPEWNGAWSSFKEELEDSNKKTYGAIMNSFSELESDYEDHYRNNICSKTWSLGPVSLWVNKDHSDKAERGSNNKNNVSNQDLINWLDSKEENSVVYVSFGSLARFHMTQLVEIAHGLEASGHQFIWAIKKKETQQQEEVDRNGALFLESFEERMKRSQQGLLLTKWAPQLLILEHPAVGATVTHCGWNSILEAVTAGLPMVTWPLFADQFYNEKLLTDVLRIGVGVGVKQWIWDWWRLSEETDAAVGREELQKAVRFVMSGEEEEALEMRRRAKKLSAAAKMAVETGGSSWSNLVALVDELKSLKINSAIVC